MRSFLRALFRKHSAPKHQAPIRSMSTSSAAALMYAASVAIPTAAAARPDDELTKTKAWHVKTGGFDNPWPSWNMHAPFTIMKGMVSRRFNGTGNIPDTTPPTVPVVTPTFLPTRTDPSQSRIRATWLGHACYYVEFPSGLRVLFDPVFEDRCSPLSWLGPKRYTPVPCQIKDIPIIDAVIISHSHYDHLSHPTIKEIHKAHPDAHFFVPLGLKKWFKDSGVTACTELDWWDEVELTLTPRSNSKSSQRTSITSTAASTASAPLSKDAITARISCLPCQHTSNRSINDRQVTLWASWSVTSAPSTSPSDSKSVWFGGDTGYRTVPKSSEGEDDWSEKYKDLPICPAFKDIGRLRGPFDLGLIPIGAYMPRWIMSPMHANPRDSVEIFRDTKCKRAMGIHWGTWVLTEEDVLEPPQKLKEALAHHGIAKTGVFDVCDIGESREFE
jgi:N-acyl-phosphatidylethanolamine-hydrolysing phospholipase D